MAAGRRNLHEPIGVQWRRLQLIGVGDMGCCQCPYSHGNSHGWVVAVRTDTASATWSVVYALACRFGFILPKGSRVVGWGCDLICKLRRQTQIKTVTKAPRAAITMLVATAGVGCGSSPAHRGAQLPRPAGAAGHTAHSWAVDTDTRHSSNR
jgi:hypothetical protein